MVGAGRDDVLVREREIGALLYRLDVVEMERAAADPTEEPCEDAAVTVASAYPLAESVPLWAVVDLSPVHISPTEV